MEILCPSCGSRYFLSVDKERESPPFCAFCGSRLSENCSSDHSLPGSKTEVSFIEGLAPGKEAVQYTIGPYQILGSIGKGGMGEVLLAYDTSCGRRIALKKIRSDLEEKEILYQRFLKEARITSQLTHPAIIPIYAIHDTGNYIYYTMPYIEGDTLKEVLRRSRRQEKKGEPIDHLGGSIPALVRILITICQAVAYAHSKNVLHRDIKPENIIIGKYGEAMILDWGLAKIVNTPLMKQIEPKAGTKLTRYGKVVGTVAYMAPERALGNAATVQSDIYSLGVILYMMLTLHQPFRRGSLKEYVTNMRKEKFIDPAEVAPYRDVPKILAEICHKCLLPHPEERYDSVEELIADLENFIEGRSEWFHIATLDMQKKQDWEFQENVLIAEHVAITRGTEVSEWMSLMISRASFSENIKLEAKVKIGEQGHGIGFLLNVPEAAERKHLNDGYCLWLASESHKATKLLRSTVEVLSYPDLTLEKEKWHEVRIEKIDNQFKFSLNGTVQFSYLGHVPVIGTRTGLLARDADFEIEDFFIYIGGQTVTVSCLAVPDAFLANKDFDKALHEYRRIGESFRGRAEGRDALFRAGITLLEKAKATRLAEDFDQALEEFSKLHKTPGALLEYLGKALTYQSLEDYEEEVKCYALALRRYPRHPLLPILRDQIVTRMHECSRFHRIATYNMILLAVRHLPEIVRSPQSAQLFSSLKNHWEPLPFFEKPPEDNGLANLSFAVNLAFWLAKPFFLMEIIKEERENPLASRIIDEAVYGLFELGSAEYAAAQIDSGNASSELEFLALCHKSGPDAAFDAFLGSRPDFEEHTNLRVLIYLLDQAIDGENRSCFHKLEQLAFSQKTRFKIDAYRVWAALLFEQKELAGSILETYPYETLSRENSIFYFLYGCWLLATEGQEIAEAHLSGILEVSYPRSWALAAHYLNGKISNEKRWFQQSFMWERRQLYRQLILYYHCLQDKDLIQKYRRLLQGEFTYE